MKNILPFLMIIFLFSCDTTAIKKDYKNFLGTWNVVEYSSSPGLLKSFIFTCAPSKKKFIKDDRAGCIGTLNTSEGDGFSLSYRLTEGNTMDITSVRKGLLNFENTPEVEKLREILYGQWTYTFSENTLKLENTNGAYMVMERE